MFEFIQELLVRIYWGMNMLVMMNWFIDGYLMSWWQQGMDILAWQRNLQVDLGVEHVMIDLMFKWNNFSNFSSKWSKHSILIGIVHV